MTAQALWTDPTGPLKKLAQTFNFDEEQLRLNEGPYVLRHTDEAYEVGVKLALPAEAGQRETKLAELDALLLELRNKYGPALLLQLRGGRPLLELNADYARAKLDKFFADHARDAVTLEVRIDKRVLAQHWGLVHPSANVKLFLYPEALVGALSHPLTELGQGDEALFGDATGEKKVLILVPGYAIELDGKYLAVVGGAAMARWANYAASTQPDPEELKFVHREAGDRLRWVQLQVNHLTPLHLHVRWEETKQNEKVPPKTDEVAAALYAQLFACSLLYMAGYSSLGGAKRGADAAAGAAATAPLWVSTFSADKYLTEFDVGDTTKLTAALKEASPDKPWEAALGVARLATWCYDVVRQRGVAERLSVLQNIVASSMQGNNPSDNCRELARQAESLFLRAEMNHEAFTQKELDKYLTQIKELEDAVGETTKGYNEQVQTLTKSLTDNMLAAVAVVVGSFIAAVFKSPFETSVFLFGTIIYVAYLLFFPVGVGLFSAWQRFDDSRTSFKRRKAEYARRLTEAGVDRLVGETVTKRERWFKNWFLGTTALYAVVLALVVFSIFTVPSLIKRWGDDFELTQVLYGETTTADAVPLIIRGENFNKDKEVVVTLGGRRFTNAGDGTLKVHGTTVLTLTPGRADLVTTAGKSGGKFTVQQGQSASKETKLPDGAVPIPQPVFERWKHTPANGGGALKAYGANYGSVSGISLDGVGWEFKSLDDGKRLELRVPVDFKDPLAGRVFDITLKNGEKVQATVSLTPATGK